MSYRSISANHKFKLQIYKPKQEKREKREPTKFSLVSPVSPVQNSAGSINPTATDDDVTVIHDDRLTGSHRVLRLIERHAGPVVP